MITVEISVEGSDDNLGMGKWSCVPAVGERLTVGGNDYTITERSWGLCCRGDGSPLWDSPCVLLSVIPENAKDQATPTRPAAHTQPTE